MHKILSAREQMLLFNTEAKILSPLDLLRRDFASDEGPGWPDRFGAGMRTWAEEQGTRIRTLSLFSGAGGLDIGFHDAGFHIPTLVEIDGRFVSTLEANSGPASYLGDVNPLCCDIRSFGAEKCGAVEFIIGGPPCQTFSAGGRRAGGVQGTDDARGTLFEEYVRLLRTLQPTAFLFENVYGITGAQGGEAWRAVTQGFRSAGYDIYARILDAADYGVPQHRERMFIVGTKGKPFRFPRPTHGPDSPDAKHYYVPSVAIAGVSLAESDSSKKVGGRFGHLLEQIPPGLNYSFFTREMGHPRPIFSWRSKFSDFLYKAHPDTPVRTIKAQGGLYTGPFHWESRPFSVDELKRLQTFPDRYKIVGGKQVAVHQIGNSVAPQVARILALCVLQEVFGVKLPTALPTLEPHEELGFRKRKRLLTKQYKELAGAALSSASHATGKTGVKSSRRSYEAALSPEFDLSRTSNLPDRFRVLHNCSSLRWRFQVFGDRNSCEPAYRVTLSSKEAAPWALGSIKVFLEADSFTPHLFTAAWKALESELHGQNVKADLVQLNNYYQYEPLFFGSMELLSGRHSWHWKSLKQLIERRGKASVLSEKDLAELLGLKSKNVLPFCLWLRTLGYEVRNNNTNPQIPRGHYLIPYIFPSLTPASVQLRKSMV